MSEMEIHIQEANSEGLKAFLNQANSSNINEGCIIEAMAECRCRERAIRLAKADKLDMDSIKALILMMVELVKAGLFQKPAHINAIQDMMDVSPLSRCKILFGTVEDMMELFREGPLRETSQANVLRMCNDLLRRLSRTVETSFCGRILLFLSRYLPLMEKSGLNLHGQFNTQNITKYETGETEVTELLAVPQDETMEIGEIEESKESLIRVDSKFYQTFWSLQAFCSNPNICFDKKHFLTFKGAISDVISTLAVHKLEKYRNDKRSRSSRKVKQDTVAEIVKDTDKYFAKYLTSTKLLQLQLNDSQFRRNILVQILIIIQYLTSDVKSNKLKNWELTDEQSRIVLEFQDKCYKLLRDTHPKGSHFVDHIKTILSREKEWAEWKNQGCYDMERNEDKTPMLMYRKRPRIEYDPCVVDLGSPELTKLWSIEPDIKKACMSESRRYVPTVEEFIRDPLDELDPEQQVDDEYKSIYNKAFQWRASRFLMSEAESFWDVKNDSKDTTDSIAVFMTRVICTAGGKTEYLNSPIISTSNASANNNNIGSSETQKLSSSALEALAGVLIKSYTLDDLVEKLHPEFEKNENEEMEPAVQRLVTQFVESKQYALPSVANAILAAHMISDDIMAALNKQDDNNDSTSS